MEEAGGWVEEAGCWVEEAGGWVEHAGGWVEEAGWRVGEVQTEFPPRSALQKPAALSHRHHYGGIRLLLPASKWGNIITQDL